MRNAFATLAAGALAALLAGCLLDRSAGATGVGNPTKGSVTVALVAEDTAPAAPMGLAAKASSAQSGARTAGSSARNPDGSFDIRDAGGTLFTVRQAFANVGRIKLALPDGIDCGDADDTPCESGQARIEGPWVSNLLTGAWTPDPGAVKLPIGAYQRLEVRLEAQEEMAAGAPDLERHSLVFGGTFAWKDRPDRPFAVALDFDEEAGFESPDGFTVGAGSNRVTIALDIAAWLARTDITACLETGSLPLDAAGGFSMDKDHGCGLEGQLKEAIKGSGSLRGEHEEGR